jgi:hypothetical protein
VVREHPAHAASEVPGVGPGIVQAQYRYTLKSEEKSSNPPPPHSAQLCRNRSKFILSFVSAMAEALSRMVGRLCVSFRLLNARCMMRVSPSCYRAPVSVLARMRGAPELIGERRFWDEWRDDAADVVSSAEVGRSAWRAS